MLNQLILTAIPGLPLIQPGDDLGALIVDHARRADFPLRDDDVIVIAQKVVSKAENRRARLEDVTPSPHALELADHIRKDARLVEVILRESREVVRTAPGLLIVEDRHGLICANAGVDRSNVEKADGEWVTLLPIDPDASARGIRDRIEDLTGQRVAVLINDSHGRPWREGASGVVIGVAGIAPLDDQRGTHDLFGYELQSTVVAVADQIAAAASLLQGQADEGRPVVVLRGLEYEARDAAAADVLRPRERDLFR